MWSPFESVGVIALNVDLSKGCIPSSPCQNHESSSSNSLVPKGPCAVCGVSSKARCGGCEGVFYCSKKHQTTDWSKHKGNCRPFSIPTQHPNSRTVAAALASSSKGQGADNSNNNPLEKPKWMTATKDISPGSTIFMEKPWCITPNP